MSLTGTLSGAELALVSTLCDQRLNELGSKKFLTLGEAEESFLLHELSGKLATQVPLDNKPDVVILNVGVVPSKSIPSELVSTVQGSSNSPTRMNTEFYQDLIDSITLSQDSSMLEVFYYTLAMIEVMENKPRFEINTYMSDGELAIALLPYAHSIQDAIGREFEIGFEVKKMNILGVNKQTICVTVSSEAHARPTEYFSLEYFKYVQTDLQKDIRRALA